MKNRKEFVTQIIETVRETIDVSEVVQQSSVPLKKVGQSMKGLCPFHNDHNIGSFVVTDQKKIWKCFACGKGGDNIKFYSLRRNIQYTEGALLLARERGIITVSEYEEATYRKFSEKENAEIEKIYAKKDMKNLIGKRADITILNEIYRIFIETCENTSGGGRLSEKHKEHLLIKRGLSEEEINKGLYFTFPTKKIMSKFLENLNEKGIPKSKLNYVPGFFIDKKNKGEQYTFRTMKNGGIGIPILNAYGLIIGIQIRKDVVEDKKRSDGITIKGSRYIWWSSNFADPDVDENLDYGASPGSPIDVVYPYKTAPFIFMTEGKYYPDVSPVIFITEGRFKAEIIAKKYNSIAISTQGVTAWRQISKSINDIEDIYWKIYKRKFFQFIYISYDADMSVNYGVFKQAVSMGQSLSKEIPNYELKYVLWDDELGKGIDDLIFNGHENCLSKIVMKSMIQYYHDYEIELNDILKRNNIDRIDKIPKEDIKCVFEKFVLSKAETVVLNH